MADLGEGGSQRAITQFILEALKDADSQGGEVRFLKLSTQFKRFFNASDIGETSKAIMDFIHRTTPIIYAFYEDAIERSKEKKETYASMAKNFKENYTRLMLAYSGSGELWSVLSSDRKFGKSPDVLKCTVSLSQLKTVGEPYTIGKKIKVRVNEFRYHLLVCKDYPTNCPLRERLSSLYTDDGEGNYNTCMKCREQKNVRATDKPVSKLSMQYYQRIQPIALYRFENLFGFYMDTWTWVNDQAKHFPVSVFDLDEMKPSSRTKSPNVRWQDEYKLPWEQDGIPYDDWLKKQEEKASGKTE